MANSLHLPNAKRMSLWIAFKLVILSYGKQLIAEAVPFIWVVNCFQISNFVLWQTASRNRKPRKRKLWIAFKLVILSYGKQRIKNKIMEQPVVNCFQISNFVLWQTASAYNQILFGVLWIAFKLVILSYGKQPPCLIPRSKSVVNCFQISNFVLWQTARGWRKSSNELLWIAFKLVILSYGKQPTPRGPLRSLRCELLSN